jgi:L-threonylcarbamoyladenylate synthase
LVVTFNAAARRLAEGFWPGALTIVLPRKQTFDSRALAGGQTAGVRVPADPVIRELALQLGPLTGTSANIAGREECRTADEVRAKLGGAVDFVVDAPFSAGGVPSTVVDATDPAHVRILREGAVTRGEIERALADDATVVI